MVTCLLDQGPPSQLPPVTDVAVGRIGSGVQVSASFQKKLSASCVGWGQAMMHEIESALLLAADQTPLADLLAPA